MTETSSVMTRDDEILSGTPVFEGTRVPVRNLFDYLAAGDPLAEFLEDFPSVSREMAIAAIREAEQAWVSNARAS